MKHKQIALIIIFSITSFIIGHVTNCKEGRKEIVHDYQMDVDEDGMTVVDNGRIVGRLKYGSNPSLDSLIDRDNQ